MGWLADILASFRRTRAFPYDTTTLVRIDPRVPFSASQATINCLGTSGPLRKLNQAGAYAADGQMRFGSVANEFLFRIDKGDPSSAADGTSQRLEVSDGVHTEVLGQSLWIGLAVSVPAPWKQAARTLTDNKSASSDETEIFQTHEAPDSFDVPSNPSLALIVGGGGRQRIEVRSNPNLVSAGRKQNTVRTVWDEPDYPADAIQYFAFNIRPHWDVAQDPFLRVWRVVDDGPLVQLVDDHAANAYNNVEHRPYLKHGLYYYPGAWTGGLTSRVMRSKGLYTWADASGIDAAGIIGFLRGI